MTQGCRQIAYPLSRTANCSECCVRRRGEEVAIQFRGAALDLSEFKNVEVLPDESIIIPLGMATA